MIYALIQHLKYESPWYFNSKLCVYDVCGPHLRLIAICLYQDHTGKMQKLEQLDGEVLMTLPSIEYIYSKWTYFPEGQQFTKKNFYWSYEVF